MSIILKETSMELLPKDEQEKIWKLSRDNEVFIEDVNGELFQVLDCTDNGEPCQFTEF